MTAYVTGLRLDMMYDNLSPLLRRPGAFPLPCIVKNQLDTPEKIIPVGRDNRAAAVTVRPVVRERPCL